MRAVLYDACGRGGRGPKLHVEVPVPSAKKNEVLLKLQAATVNPLDWKIQKGDLRPLLPRRLPFIPVTDVAGVVVDVGPGVNGLTAGDQVVAKLNSLNGGGLAEYAVASANLTVKRPAKVSAAEGAGLPIAAGTALQALRSICAKFDGISKPLNVLITAASGGVGLYAVQLAKLLHGLAAILRIYSQCSGQSVHMGKSSVFFSPNTTESRRIHVKQMLGIDNEAFSERYLGLPTAIGRLTSGTFDYMEERCRGKMNGWSERTMACAARETLLKSIIQAIPAHSMSCFLLTKKICSKLTSLMARYWWGSSLDKRYMHWLAWDKLTVPKCKGGMGFRDFNFFNLAMLGKHGWRLLTDPTSLCARVLKGRYFPDCDFMQASVPSNSSATWRAIIAGRDALSVGLINRIGDGSSVSAWDEKWIPGTLTMKPIVRPANTSVQFVSYLIDNENWSWWMDLVRDTFVPTDAAAILNIPLRSGGGANFLAWAFEKSGIYTVKSAYRALMIQKERVALEEGPATGASNANEQMWNRLWKLNVVPKIRVFWWRHY